MGCYSLYLALSNASSSVRAIVSFNVGSVMEPPQQMPGKLLSIPVLYLIARQLKTIDLSPDNIGIGRAGTGKSGFSNKGDCLCRVIAKRVGKARHWAT